MQEVAGCSFLEARVYLRRERNETLEELASKYDMDIDEIRAIEKIADEKAGRVQSSGNLFYGHEPIYPGEDEIIEW